MESKNIIEAGKKLMPDCDYIVDLYDLYFVWASERALTLMGYRTEELLEKRNFELLPIWENKQLARKRLFERIVEEKGEEILVVKKKNGELVRLKVLFQQFEFEGGWYMMGKILEVVEIDR